jgi:DNA-binding NarL/FixJ family response regulator
MEQRTRLPHKAAHQSLDVWVVEDDSLFRNTLSRVIDHSQGFICAHALESCEEAIARLEQSRPPQVILMDIMLPGMDGIQGSSRIKAMSPSTNILILTNYADNDKIFRALCAGASGYLLKTSPPEEIRRAIQEVVNGGAAMNAQIARKVLDMFTGLTLPNGHYGLTERESEILKLMVAGHSKKKLADILFISYYTVDTHIKNIYAKLHVHSRSGAITKVLREHLV